MAHRSYSGITKEVIEDLLACPLCYEKYDSTKIGKFLPCLHTYCVHCLERHANNQRSFKCPLCMRDTDVPSGGVECLPDNFIVAKLRDLEHLINADVNRPGRLHCGSCTDAGPAFSFCYDCSVFLCQQCDISHKRLLAFKSHHTLSMQQLQQTPEIKLPLQKRHCHIHTSKPVELFCNEEQCQIPICLLCGQTSHQQHNLVDLDQKSSDVKQELKSLAEVAKDKITPVKESSGKIDSEINRKSRHFEEVSMSITKIFEEIQEMVIARKEKVLAELKNICLKQTKCLKQQSQRAESLASGLESAYQFAERACDIGNPVDLLQTREQVISRLHELLGLDIDTLLPSGSTDEEFVVVEEDKSLLESLISRIGNLTTNRGLEDAKITWNVSFVDQDVSCLPVNDPLEVQISGEHNAGLDLNSFSGRFHATLIAPDGSSTECTDYCLAGNCLKFCFEPLVTGQHQLNISLSGVPISGSPFDLNVVAECPSPESVHSLSSPSKTPLFEVTWSDAFAKCEHTTFLKLPGTPGFIPSIDNITARYTMSDNSETEDVQPEMPSPFTADIEATSEIDTFKIIYTPEKDGLVNMTIFIDGNPIGDTPFVVNVSPLHHDFTTVSAEVMGACSPNSGVLDMPYNLTVVTYDYRNRRLTSGGYDITAEALPDTLESPQEFVVTDNRDGSYKITCIPRVQTTHTVRMNICGHPVNLSNPFEFSVSASLSFQEPPDGYSIPSSLTFDKERNIIYVVDARKGAIMSFATDGSFVKSFQFENTLRSALIAINTVDELVALTPARKMVKIFTIATELRHEYSWTCNEVKRATSLALSPNGHVVIGDSQSQALFIYKLTSGDFVTKIPLTRGSLAPGMSNVCMDSQNEILMARHSEPHQLVRYSLTGDELPSLSPPVESNQLAVATTSEGHVIVATVDVLLVMDASATDIIKTIPTEDRIYTGIIVTNDKCFVAFEPGMKHLAKYSYAIE